MRHAPDPITMIVGASGHGIGPAVAEHLAGLGHHLALIGRNEQRLEQVRLDVEDKAKSVRVHVGDAIRPRRIKKMVDDMLIHYGRVDNLVYIPAAETFKPFLKTDETELEEHLDLAVRGPWNWMQSLVPVMADHGGGRLIFMSATAGKRGFVNMSAFSAAKFALHGLIESVAREHRDEGIQPVALVLDGMLDHPGMRRRLPDKDDWSDAISMEAVAKAVEYIVRQDVRGMSHELWITPGKERW